METLPIHNHHRKRGVHKHLIENTIWSLQIGQGFDMPALPVNSNYAYKAAKSLDMRVSIENLKNGSIRVWRVE